MMATKENRKVARGRARNPKGDECYICGKRGHVQKDCWYKDTRGDKGKGKVKGKGKQKGNGKDKDKSVTEVSQEDSQSSNNRQIVANFTSDWIFAVTWAASLEEIYESEVKILLDSGAYDHVCIPEFANHSPLLPRLDTGTVRNADGSEIPTHGQVMNVKRCIFSIGRLIEQGFKIDFERQVLTGPDVRAQLLEQERATQVNPVWVEEPGNEKEMNEHEVGNENAHTVCEQMDVQKARGVREPRQPTERERSEHSLTQVPFRSWCKACVLAHSKDNPHRPLTLYERKRKDKTTIQLDYMFSWCDGDCKVLTMTETKTGFTCARVVLAKGSGDRYAVHALKEMIDEVGDPEANIRVDSEGAADGGSTET